MSETLSAALEYHALGWSVIPTHADSKLPAVRSWKPYQTKPADVAQLRKWFGNGRRLGLAVVCGDVSGGLVVRDFDTMESYQQWAAANPKLAGTLPTVATHRGRHVYCRADLAPIRRASKGDGGILTLGDGELRGGGYCVLPPSTHPAGGRYRWLLHLNGELPVVDLIAAGLLPSDREDTAYTPDTPLCPPSSLYAPSSTSTLSHDAIEVIIGRTLPSRPGQRHRLLFELARELKALPAWNDAPLAALKPIVRQWHGLALPMLGTKPFEESWLDFAEGWQRVKYPKGQEPIAMALKLADAAELPEAALEYEQVELRRLVALCRVLQRKSGDHPFFLACRTAAGLLGVNHATAARWLKLLAIDGIVSEVEKGSRSTRRASRFRYLAPL
ncbi:MAG: bifunctional DNA primase/polymerase [Planctomycetia bacterium]|nr:bifunctional DNA primase/polymerase [Planctomycetia bacterium]